MITSVIVVAIVLVGLGIGIYINHLNKRLLNLTAPTDDGRIAKTERLADERIELEKKNVEQHVKTDDIGSVFSGFHDRLHERSAS